MKRYPLALFIGRFQPFHKGHLWEIKRALKLAEKLIVGIGSSNLEDRKNPYPSDKRRRMVEVVLAAEGIGERVIKIEELPDTTDQEWVDNVKKMVVGAGYQPGETLVIGNNDWVNDLLEPEGFVIYEPGFYNREELEGVKIREMMKTGDNGWKSRVPEEVARQINVVTVEEGDTFTN